VPVGKVLEVEEVFADPQVQQREMVLDLEHPKFGTVRQIGFGIKLSDTPGSVRTLGAPLGHDTDAVLSSAGYSPAEIRTLREQGVIF
jgi:crotonobetainyl-CoA:carnitine CoA-transferase CaiB-like acyl-CoA transferase